jgi:hypothetical protein
MPRLLPLVALALTITGCGGPDYAHRRVEGDTVIFTDHWSSSVVVVVLALAFASVGLSVSFYDYYHHLWQPKEQDSQKRRRKRQAEPPGRFGSLFFTGLVFALLGIVVISSELLMRHHHYVAVNRQRYYSHWDIFGRESTSVDLAEVTAMHVTKVRVAGRRSRIRTQVLFIHENGERQRDLVTSGAERAALEYLIKKAPDWGFEVDDRREKK